MKTKAAMSSMTGKTRIAAAPSSASNTTSRTASHKLTARSRTPSAASRDESRAWVQEHLIAHQNQEDSIELGDSLEMDPISPAHPSKVIVAVRSGSAAQGHAPGSALSPSETAIQLEGSHRLPSHDEPQTGPTVSEYPDNHFRSSWEWLERKEQALVDSLRQGESAAQKEWLRMQRSIPALREVPFPRLFSGEDEQQRVWSEVKWIMKCKIEDLEAKNKRLTFKLKRCEEAHSSANKRILDLEETMNVMSRSFEQDLKRSQERADTLESERDVLLDELQKCRAKLQASAKSRSELQDSQQELLKAWKAAGEEIESLKHNLQMEKERSDRADARSVALERDGVMKSKEMGNQMQQFRNFQSELEADVLRLQAELSSTQERLAEERKQKEEAIAMAKEEIARLGREGAERLEEANRIVREEERDCKRRVEEARAWATGERESAERRAAREVEEAVARQRQEEQRWRERMAGEREQREDDLRAELQQLRHELFSAQSGTAAVERELELEQRHAQELEGRVERERQAREQERGSKELAERAVSLAREEAAEARSKIVTLESEVAQVRAAVSKAGADKKALKDRILSLSLPQRARQPAAHPAPVRTARETRWATVGAEETRWVAPRGRRRSEGDGGGGRRSEGRMVSPPRERVAARSISRSPSPHARTLSPNPRRSQSPMSSQADAESAEGVRRRGVREGFRAGLSDSESDSEAWDRPRHGRLATSGLWRKEAARRRSSVERVDGRGGGRGGGESTRIRVFSPSPTRSRGDADSRDVKAEDAERKGAKERERDWRDFRRAKQGLPLRGSRSARQA